MLTPVKAHVEGVLRSHSGFTGITHERRGDAGLHTFRASFSDVGARDKALPLFDEEKLTALVSKKIGGGIVTASKIESNTGTPQIIFLLSAPRK